MLQMADVLIEYLNSEFTKENVLYVRDGVYRPSMDYSIRERIDD